MRRILNAVALALSATAMLAACNPAPPAFDVLIVDGTVYDGSRNQPRVATMGIRDGKIAAIGVPADARAARRIDATGLAVMPGFIDPHTHALDDLLAAETAANVNFLRQGVTTVFVGSDGAGVPRHANKLATLREQGTGPNVAWFAGHGDIRTQVLGLGNRAPTEAELDAMREILAKQMEAGAIGLSTGLFYTPGSFATTAEVIQLATVAARFGGVYDTHMRSESSFGDGLLNAVRETVQIAEEAGIAVHISHLKALGQDLWGQSGDIIEIIDNARSRGLNVTANQYPYQASGTRFSAALVPQWARADSRDAMLARLANPDLADRLRREMTENLRIRGGGGAMLVTEADSPWRGQTLDEIAATLQRDELDAAVDVIRGGDPSIASFVMERQDIHALAIQPWMMTGSDGSSGHPRKYGTYPEAFREFVTDHDLMTVPDFVHRSSGLVADTFGLCNRGYLQPGRQADIILVDLDHYRARATFEEPSLLAEGVRHVFINGIDAVTGGELTGALPGTVVHRQALDCPRP